MNGTRENLDVWRHYEAAAEAAASLLALSRCRTTDREPAHALHLRQRLQLIDLLHTFAYNARRAIELAEQLETGTISHAQSISVRPYGRVDIELEIMEDARPLADQSVWWILGRIIHARELNIHYLEDAEVGTEWAPKPHITVYSMPVAFSVRSDHDGPEERHFVLIAELLAAYLALRGRFVKAMHAAGYPLEEHSLFY